MLAELKSGEELLFGGATVRDDGIMLLRHKFLSTEPVRCHWHQSQIWSADGTFYIGAKNDKKVYVGLSYIQEANVHILEQAIRMAFKKGVPRLSMSLD
jgi:hypothetical protein